MRKKQLSYTITSLAFFLYWVIPHVRNEAEKGMDDSHTKVLPVPWTREAPFTRLLMTNTAGNGAARFHRPDLWHSIHLGIGKAWVASSLLVLAKHIAGGNLDDKFAAFNGYYMSFCRERKLDRLISKLEKHHCGAGGSTEAIGSWSKAALTSNLCRFLEHLCSIYSGIVGKNDALKLIETWPD